MHMKIAVVVGLAAAVLIGCSQQAPKSSEAVSTTSGQLPASAEQLLAAYEGLRSRLANDEEIHASSLQFVRKLSGCTRPSQANEAAFDLAVDEVAVVARKLVDSLVTSAPPRNREVEAAKARARTAQRFGSA